MGTVSVPPRVLRSPSPFLRSLGQLLCALFLVNHTTTFCRGLPQAVGFALPSLSESQKCVRASDQLGQEPKIPALLPQVRANSKVSMTFQRCPWDQARLEPEITPLPGLFLIMFYCPHSLTLERSLNKPHASTLSPALRHHLP